jgi:hypothetical protein
MCPFGLTDTPETKKAAPGGWGEARRGQREDMEWVARRGRSTPQRPIPQLHLYRPLNQARSYAPHGTRTLAERGAGTPKSPGALEEEP